MRKSFSYALRGGLDEVSQPLEIAPGAALACLNFEAVETGYGYIDGFERYDGRTGPTDYPFWILPFDQGATAILEGFTVTGGTSGATGIILLDAVLAGGEWDGTGQGVIGLRAVAGTFQTGEMLLVAMTPVARVAGPGHTGEALSGIAIEEDIAEAARDYARALIQTVPGANAVRGVWELNGFVYAVRDAADGTQARLWRASDTGWEAVALGSTLAFTSGGAVEISEGDTITGATSGATALVRRVIIEDGDWAAGDAQGYFVLSNIAGTFQAENLNTANGANLATIAGVPIAILLPPGGRYFTVTNNFYGASGTRRIYGVSGVTRGFEFDGAVYVPIRTGMAFDTPMRVAVYRNHLFFAFPGGSVQHSAPSEPISWEPVLGAAEIMFGSEVADFISNIESLLILCEHGIFVLSGYDITDWQKGTITEEAGAIPFTGQRIGPGLYLDNRGLRSVTATQSYGNFSMGTITETVKKTMRRKQAGGILPGASMIVRSKSHYRMFYDDGTGLSFYLGRKRPEPMYFDLGKPVRCISSTEGDDGMEHIYFGSDDGYVYQLDKGTSFDGEPIEAFIQFAYSHCGSPNLLKRVFKVGLEVTANGGSPIGVAVEFDYSQNEQISASQSTVTAQGSGGLWGVANWAEFFWSSPVENVLETEVEGQGRNVSIIAYSNSARIPQYVLRGATVYYGERGSIR